MPANLPPQYVKLENEFRQEKDLARRLELLQEMLREIPKHKGTNHLQGELKSKISKFKAQIESGGKSTGSRQSTSDHIPKEGAGQFALIGPPNGGKSSVVGVLTKAKVEITEWPFATRHATPGMARWENVSLQLIDTPSIAAEFCDPAVFNLIRNADVAVIVLSLGDDSLLDQLEYTINRVLESKVLLFGLGREDASHPAAAQVKAMIIATGADLPDATSRFDMLKSMVPAEVPVVSVSNTDGVGLDEFLKVGFAMLGRTRVYTKSPGKKPDLDDPVLLSAGGTVLDAARSIHKDIAERLQFARLWKRGETAVEGRRVPADHIVEEGDILEFHV